MSANPEQRNTNPDIAESTHELKALHAQPDAVVPVENQDSRIGKKGIGWKRPVAAVALLAAGVGVFGATRGGGDAAPAPERSPSASSSATPGETEPNATPEFGLSVAEFQGNPQALTQAYYEQLNAFRIAGIPDEKPDRAYEITPEEFVDEVGAPVNEAFKEAMFAPGWEQDDSLASYVANNEEVARFVRETRLRSMSGTQERYSETMTAVDVSTVSESPLTIRSDWEQVTSGGEGIVTDESLQTDTGSDLITWGEFDGQYKIVDIEDGSPS